MTLDRKGLMICSKNAYWRWYKQTTNANSKNRKLYYTRNLPRIRSNFIKTVVHGYHKTLQSFLQQNQVRLSELNMQAFVALRKHMRSLPFFVVIVLGRVAKQLGRNVAKWILLRRYG